MAKRDPIRDGDHYEIHEVDANGVTEGILHHADGSSEPQRGRYSEKGAPYRLTPCFGNIFKVKPSGNKGPAKVNSQAFRDSWDRMFKKNKKQYPN